ncbi:deoxynucleoside triphosphate triphosphohydrolase SAMHD1-like isoform X2 [Patella vulgata]|uniref:deoxynucleoside triphosphate triphosphohydrolase SAMHD1-like isoform X1 n=1 Tax=Patella vulgata TaxID=6465 RepID=UPI0021800930|nr:deoxynucleoside triphosphate triphosphohydrolase SAMHD1-like isoform X1 [Patella vulgata]XP_055956015.1 deoxynucleoside triphosphate triphosphohydrolase SAMHD1-like isoform X2 [Patella vulgata]
MAECIKRGKIFNDPVHGHIEIPPLCMKIVDTPEFQRLRFLKQMGPVYYVYPGASHNRFEHSLGVCHLAGAMISQLQKQDPNLGITPVEVLCVQIAGLCHDLGHGPFSHLFDNVFIPLVAPQSNFTHEEASIKMFQHLIKENNLMADFEYYNLKQEDIDFIKELIAGPSNEDNIRREKKYLYEIVANKRNSVDVDKFDYFARDCYMLGFKNNFDHNRFLQFFRVIKDENGDHRICIRDKEAENLYEMFHTRKNLHCRACKHVVTQAVECMIVDALVIADDCETFTFPGKDNTPRRLRECIDDMVAYKKLDDTIFQRIMWSTEPELQGARDLIDRIQKRQLYKCVGLAPRPEHLDKEREKKVPQEIADLDDQLNPDILTLSRVHYDYCMKDEDPVRYYRFYEKPKHHDTEDGPIKKCLKLCEDQGPQMLPAHFQVDMIRIFCKAKDKKTIQAAESAFKQWCDDNEVTPETIRGGFRFEEATNG